MSLLFQYKSYKRICVLLILVFGVFYYVFLSGKKSLPSFDAYVYLAKKKSYTRFFFHKSNQLSFSSAHSVYSQAALYSFSGLPLIFCVYTTAVLKNVGV